MLNKCTRHETVKLLFLTDNINERMKIDIFDRPNMEVIDRQSWLSITLIDIHDYCHRSCGRPSGLRDTCQALALLCVEKSAEGFDIYTIVWFLMCCYVGLDLITKNIAIAHVVFNWNIHDWRPRMLGPFTLRFISLVHYSADPPDFRRVLPDPSRFRVIQFHRLPRSCIYVRHGIGVSGVVPCCPGYFRSTIVSRPHRVGSSSVTSVLFTYVAWTARKAAGLHWFLVEGSRRIARLTKCDN